MAPNKRIGTGRPPLFCGYISRDGRLPVPLIHCTELWKENLNMPHSLAQIYVHIVFSTKNREPYLKDKAASLPNPCVPG